MRFLLVIFSLGLLISRAQASDIPPETYPSYCPAGFTSQTPLIWLTDKRLTPTQAQIPASEELHRVICEKRDPVSLELKARWQLYFCEDLNINHYAEKLFTFELTSWFTFHPNFKKVEFMLFPKWPKLRRDTFHPGGKAVDVAVIHFMHSFDKQMEIWFANGEGEQAIKKGAKSISAAIFLNAQQKYEDSLISCTLE